MSDGEGTARIEGEGKVSFVGAGPGAPGLVTVRGADLVARADVLVHDASVSDVLVASCPAACARIVVDAQRDAAIVATELAAYARAGQAVVRLATGDPLLSARVAEEIAAVTASGVAIEVVPGIVPALAVGAYAGVASASRTIALTRTDASGMPHAAWEKLAWAADTLLADTDAAGVSDAAARLLAEGRDPSTPAAVVADLTRPSQRVKLGTLADIATRARAFRDERLILVVGDRVAADAGLGWFAAQPLVGKRVLVTRTREQASSTAALLRDRGAEPIVFPTIVLHPPPDPAPLEAAVRALGGDARRGVDLAYDWVAFTSANAVDFMWREAERQGRDARVLGNVHIAAIGPGTAAALAARGIVADVVAKEFKGEGLADAMLARMAPAGAGGLRVLLPRAREAREVLPETLRAAGCHVDVVAAYETRPPDPVVVDGLVRLLEEGSVDVALFTSSSTAENLCTLLGDRAATLLADVTLASIGPITSAALERRGLRADVTAAVFTVPGLVAALESFFRTG